VRRVWTTYRPSFGGEPGSGGLAPAQTRVTELVLQGRSTQQIVNEVYISAYTVQEHVRAVFDKLGVRSRSDLMASLLERDA
jgi:DNA-binding CsgD family transcriptional regulator